MSVWWLIAWIVVIVLCAIFDGVMTVRRNRREAKAWRVIETLLDNRKQ